MHWTYLLLFSLFSSHSFSFWAICKIMHNFHWCLFPQCDDQINVHLNTPIHNKLRDGIRKKLLAYSYTLMWEQRVEQNKKKSYYTVHLLTFMIKKNQQHRNKNIKCWIFSERMSYTLNNVHNYTHIWMFTFCIAHVRSKWNSPMWTIAKICLPKFGNALAHSLTTFIGSLTHMSAARSAKNNFLWIFKIFSSRNNITAITYFLIFKFDFNLDSFYVILTRYVSTLHSTILLL